MSDIQFDLTKITAREIAPYLTSMAKGHMSWMLDIMPLIVTACPWGEPTNPETYDLPLFSEQAKLLFGAFQKVVLEVPERITFASFDLQAIKAKDFDILVDQINGTKPDVIAELLAKYVKACPEVGDDTQNPNRYLDMPYYTQFRVLAKKLSGAGKDQLENFLKQSADK